MLEKELSKLHVILTDEDLENGKAKQCRSCPYAIAITRALKRLATVSNKKITVAVGVSDTVLEIDSVCFWVKNPIKMSDNILYIDTHRSYLVKTGEASHMELAFQPF